MALRGHNLCFPTHSRLAFRICENQGFRSFPAPLLRVGDDAAAFLRQRMHLGGCQNYGPFLGPYYNTGPNLGDPKRDHNFDNPPFYLQWLPSRRSIGSSKGIQSCGHSCTCTHKAFLC